MEQWQLIINIDNFGKFLKIGVKSTLFSNSWQTAFITLIFILVVFVNILNNCCWVYSPKLENETISKFGHLFINSRALFVLSSLSSSIKIVSNSFTEL